MTTVSISQRLLAESRSTCRFKIYRKTFRTLMTSYKQPIMPIEDRLFDRVRMNEVRNGEQKEQKYLYFEIFYGG